MSFEREIRFNRIVNLRVQENVGKYEDTSMLIWAKLFAEQGWAKSRVYVLMLSDSEVIEGCILLYLVCFHMESNWIYFSRKIDILYHCLCLSVEAASIYFVTRLRVTHQSVRKASVASERSRVYTTVCMLMLTRITCLCNSFCLWESFENGSKMVAKQKMVAIRSQRASNLWASAWAKTKVVRVVRADDAPKGQRRLTGVVVFLNRTCFISTMRVYGKIVYMNKVQYCNCNYLGCILAAGF